MALGATIFKCELQVSDLDRGYYQTHQLTIARHPSETDERMMMRLLAFALNADERLAFSRGLSADDEAVLWQHSLSGEIELWIDLGQPDEKRLRKACGRAQRVLVYSYQHRAASIWWQQNRAALTRLERLTVIRLADGASAELAALAQRNMQINCTIQDGEVWLADATCSVHLVPEVLA